MIMNMGFSWSSKYVSDEQILTAIASSNSMLSAAGSLKMRFMTFRRRAKKINAYKPNQGRTGISRSIDELDRVSKIDIYEVLKGNILWLRGGDDLKKRLIRRGIKQNKCEECGITEWNGKPLIMEMHHIDCNSHNNRLENLRILCANCHGQLHSIINGTKPAQLAGTVKRKVLNRKKCPRVTKHISDEQIVKAAQEYPTMLLAARSLNVSMRNFKRRAIELNAGVCYDEALRIKNEQRIETLLKSDIDFSKFGWVMKVSVLLNMHPQKVNKWMKNNMPDLYNDKCFKRKNAGMEELLDSTVLDTVSK